jgi:hypothetical protein
MTVTSALSPTAAAALVWPAIRGAFDAALESPRYQALLAAVGVDPAAILDLETFCAKVPLIRKADLFADSIPFQDLCRGGSLGNPRELMASSGFSGHNAFGVLTPEEDAKIEAAIDDGFAMLFAADQHKTLIVNAFGMGIHLRTAYTLVATGPRPDLVLSVLRKFGRYFEQVIILGDPHLLKWVVDDGNAVGMRWDTLNISFLSGEDWLPETLRSYICAETGIDTDVPGSQRRFLRTMGLTELGLLLFFESPELVRLRRLAQQHKTLRQALFGSESAVVPSLFHFDPRRFYVESVPGPSGPELVFTTLSLTMLVPLIRYASGDLGQPINGAALTPVLACLGLANAQPLLPLPLAWTTGRMGLQGLGTHPIGQDAIRHALYADIPLARSLTGHFALHRTAAGEELAVQLRPGVAEATGLQMALSDALTQADPKPAMQSLPAVRLYPYEGYPVGMALDFERKFRHA